MARRRLPPPLAPEEAPMMLETKGYPLGVAPTYTRPPVARVAAEAAAEAGLRAVSAELETLRAEGRVVLRLALAAVQDDWLIRDRVAGDGEGLAELVASIREHGQRTPIEVAELAPGRFGLISGWRRMAALRQLAAGDARFDTVLALVRRPETAAEAYVAMVEENEIRVGLSYWERARVVARACAAGVFGSDKIALQRLFAHASRARRSKIGSFLPLVAALDGVLRFPAALPERLGLRLAAALETDATLPARIRAALDAAPPADAGAEQALLAAALARPAPKAPARRDLAPGLWLEGGPGRAVLGGPAVDAAFLDRLARLLAAPGGG
jgi:ParB/RepB/Spo0J family partition protein